MNNQKFCTNCGSELLNSPKFCSSCGIELFINSSTAENIAIKKTKSSIQYPKYVRVIAIISIIFTVILLISGLIGLRDIEDKLALTAVLVVPLILSFAAYHYRLWALYTIAICYFISTISIVVSGYNTINNLSYFSDNLGTIKLIYFLKGLGAFVMFILFLNAISKVKDTNNYKKYSGILGNSDLSMNKQNLLAFKEYLSEKFNNKTLFTGISYLKWDIVEAFNNLELLNYENSIEIPDNNDTFKFESFDTIKLDSGFGVLLNAIRVTDSKEFQIPLTALKISPPANKQLKHSQSHISAQKALSLYQSWVTFCKNNFSDNVESKDMISETTPYENI
ncbi:hypothetical protein DF185_18640 [Marinifilum breve]|uniref:Zinc-ribbon domain-containing protein n=1 Tax=Marinifilum breve TaxID=2184082 RepID=A0A2V3ZVI3_9BACT|nr:zinc ribbon domain-containing protein [Marinifilum breve]PXX97043.1 hypothetical protein DF185_18640 [Marinifilum breve]